MNRNVFTWRSHIELVQMVQGVIKEGEVCRPLEDKIRGRRLSFLHLYKQNYFLSELPKWLNKCLQA